MRVNVELVEASEARAKRAGLARRMVPTTERPRAASPDQREARFSTILAATGNPVVARTQLERLLGGNDLVGISYLEVGARCGRAVCRVHLKDASGNTVGFGTGFLVGPGVMMTNHHVIGSTAEAASATAEFDYELDAAGRDRVVAEFQILTDPVPIPVKDLDFCLVAVSARSRDGGRALADFGWLPLDPTPGKAFVGEYLTIIQHPGGERKQVCVRENKLIRYEDADNTLWYQTDTVAGSSGSPTFNNSWQVVALHHAGIPRTDDQGRWLTIDGKVWDQSMDESRVAWIANEGIRVSRIVEHLSTNYAGHSLAQLVLARTVPPAVTPVERAGTGGGASSLRDGELRVTIPVEIAVRVGSYPQAATTGARPPQLPQLAPAKDVGPTPDVAGFEAVVINQSDYAKRPGFDPMFLGAGNLRVPLPKLSASLSNRLAQVTGNPRGELKYWDYSVLMNKTRRLAFFSVVNVDASLRPTNAGRDGDRWYVDTRVKAVQQLDQSFYGEQRSFEAASNRLLNPFDRGHLTRRLDAQWGAEPATSSRNGNDSFHFTNCAPQHWKYNQGAKKWLGLEDYVISKFAGGRRASVINGPVFDAPLSVVGADGRLAPRVKGKSHPDPTFGGVGIPKLFFKIVACAQSGNRLGVAAFLMSQEDLLRTMGTRLKGLPPAPEEVLTDAEAKLYQVRVSDVEVLTGLDFGLDDENTVGGSNEGIGMSGSAPTPRPIQSFDDLRL